MFIICLLENEFLVILSLIHLLHDVFTFKLSGKILASKWIVYFISNSRKSSSILNNDLNFAFVPLKKSDEYPFSLFSFDFSFFLRFLEFFSFLFFSFPRRPKLRKNHFDNNEEWDYLDMNILRRISQQHGDARHEHSLTEYTLKIKRRPLYYTMLMIMPCVVCTLLVLASFAIPPEISERIGFCSTVMLSISVYLLIMADMLPEKSDTLPILGIYYIITMLEIALAIIGTIIVLRIYHSASEPPDCFKTL